MHLIEHNNNNNNNNNNNKKNYNYGTKNAHEIVPIVVYFVKVKSEKYQNILIQSL